MAPSRVKQESTSAAGPSKERSGKKSRNHPYLNQLLRSTHEDALPGVQKLKSALRQTKRLLSRANLAADVRVETERRLKALEADLARAERSRKERQYARKYHKVKFFERQKVVRKIKQIKRSIATSETEEKKGKLKAILRELRVDLNYVLHFPKTEKYISLFPPEVRGSSPAVVTVDDDEGRSKVREIIRQRMECGGLGTEPETELGKLGRENKPSVSNRRGADIAPPIKARIRSDEVASDDFFGDDDEEDKDDEDSQQSEVSDP